MKSRETSPLAGAPLDDAGLAPTNSDISELLAIEADSASQPLQRAFRRAARKALLWTEEASQLYRERRSLTELSGIGPYLEKIVRRWLEHAPAVPDPPDIRRNFFTWTEAHSILQKEPLWAQSVKGDLQMHTLWSDGSGSIQEMAEAGDALGYEYIALTDHSKGLKIAGGINEEQLEQQAVEIAGVNDSLERAGRRLRVVHSVELNLSPTGEGDMSNESLRRLDLVLGCFHSALRKKDDQTDRYIAALRNPDIQILGHPRGRIYNFRIGLSADWPRVFAVAAELDKAVEIDSYPDRQDLSLDLIRQAKRAGCRISLGTDAHGPDQLRFIQFGLAAACRAGIVRSRILNFMARRELMDWVEGVRTCQIEPGCSWGSRLRDRE
jgi:histidinol phosphatase-like PHP family hydrolase